MEKAAEFRTAIVGCGQISEFHIAALRDVAGLEIVAVCDLNETLARERAAQAGVELAFADMAKMMRETRPNVVHILTPPATHRTLSENAVGHGAHVYVEKPMAGNAADAQAMVAMAEQFGVSLCTGHSRLFDPPFLEASRRIRDGEIGRVVSVRAEQGFTYLPAARSAVIHWSYTYDWGIFDDLMPHPLSLATHFLSEPGDPEVIALNLGSVREAAVDEIRAVIPSAAAVAEISLSLSNSPELNRLEVVGTRGRIVVDFGAMTTIGRSESGLPPALTRFTANFGTAIQLAEGSLGVAAAIARGKVKRFMGLRLLVSEFYRSLREGSPPPVSPQDALVVVSLMDAIKERCRSSAKHRVRAAAETSATETSRARVLVTGATGFLGGCLVQRLADRGTAVRATTRLESRARPLPNVEWVHCDITSEGDLRAALAGVETIFHCAAMAGPPGSQEEYREANVAATLRLAKAAAEAEVKTLIYVSSMSVYGMPRRRGYLDESEPYDDRVEERGVYTQTKLAAERGLLEFAQAHEAPRVVVLRPGAIYGPGAPIPVGHLRLPSTDRRPLVAGGRRVPIPLTFIDNVVDALLGAAESDVPSGSIYNIVDSADTDQGDVARMVQRASGGRIRPIFVPYPFVWTAMLGLDLISLVRGRRLGKARFRLRRALAPMRFDTAAARRDFGWEPRVSLGDGLTRIFEREAEPPFPY